MYERSYQQILDIFIKPEIKRRVDKKLLPSNFELTSFQVILSKKDKAVVRINDETEIAIAVKVTEQVSQGDIIELSDADNIQAIKPFNLGGDWAHYSALKIKNKWYVFFDFRYDKKKAESYINSALEFFDSATADLKSRRWRSLVNNLYLSVELLTKAELVLLPAYKEGFKSHTYWRSEYNKWHKLGNTESRFSSLLNELSQIWNKARYSYVPFNLAESKAKAYLELTHEMSIRTRNLII